MKQLLSVSAAAALLGLNPQTIYRKVKRGELQVVRIGKTIRIALEEIAGEAASPPSPKPVPDFIKRLLWDLDTDQVLDSSAQVAERVLEYGDIGDVEWLFSVRERSAIADLIRRRGARRLTPRSVAFWQRHLGLINEEKHTHRSTGQALGETRWR